MRLFGAASGAEPLAADWQVTMGESAMAVVALDAIGKEIAPGCGTLAARSALRPGANSRQRPTSVNAPFRESEHSSQRVGPAPETQTQ